MTLPVRAGAGIVIRAGAGTFLSGNGSGASTPTFTVGVTPTSGNVGSTLMVSFTPGVAWTVSPISISQSGVSGSFAAGATTLAVSIGTTTPATINFTPSSAGTASFNGTLSGWASNGPATYTAITAGADPGHPPAYTPPSTIPLTVMPHGSSPTNAVYASKPGFARGQWNPSTQKLTGTVGSTTFDWQVDQLALWKDGTVRTARVVAPIPATLTDGVETSVAVQVASGTASTTALVTPAALVAAKDFTVKHYGLDCGSNTFITSVRNIVTSGPRDTWGTNPLQGWDVPISGPNQVMIRAWTVWYDPTAAAYDKWRRDTVYVSYSIDGTYDMACRTEQSNWDVAFPTATLGGTTQKMCKHYVEMYDGATRIGAWGGVNDPRTAVIANTAFNTSTGAITFPSTMLDYQCVSFTGGTLPAPLVSGTPYWMQGGKLFSYRQGAIYDYISFNSTNNVVTFSYNLPQTDYLMCSFLSGGGTLPSPLAINTNYWFKATTGGYFLYTVTSKDYATDTAAAPISFTGNGLTIQRVIQAGRQFASQPTGTVTMVPVVASYYGSGMLLMTSAGAPVVVGSRPRITGKWDETYMSKNARLFPAYDQTFTRTSYTAAGEPIRPATYYPNTAKWDLSISTTGDNYNDTRVGMLDLYSLKAMLLPHDIGYGDFSSAQACSWSDWGQYFNDVSSGRMMVLDNGPTNSGTTYTNMGPCRPNASCNGSVKDGWLSITGGGLTLSDWSGYTDGYSSAFLDGSHCPAPWAVPAFLTGHPIFSDMGPYNANAQALYSTNSGRQITSGGTTYWNCLGSGQQDRGVGWALRIAGFAEAFTAANDPIAPYLSKMLDSTAGVMGSIVTNQSAGLTNLGYSQYDPATSPATKQFFMDIKGVALGLEAYRDERPAFRVWARVMSNFTLGISNDGSSTGGSGYFMSDSNQILNFLNGGTPWTSPRDFVLNSPHWNNPTLPFPATGSTDASFNDPGTNVRFKASNYSVMHLAAMAAFASAGIVSPNGDDATTEFNRLKTRLNTSPCTGIQWSFLTTPPTFWPQHAIVPVT